MEIHDKQIAENLVQSIDGTPLLERVRGKIRELESEGSVRAEILFHLEALIREIAPDTTVRFHQSFDFAEGSYAHKVAAIYYQRYKEERA